MNLVDRRLDARVVASNQSMSRARATAPALLVVGVVALTVAGCISSQPPSQTGIRIGDETLEQFKAGVTTEKWLVAVLGEPTSQSEVKSIPNTKVFRYTLGEAAGGLGAIFSGEASKNTATNYFIITDGIVTRYWADRTIERTMFGAPVEASPGEKQ